ncbi:MAG: hypothetical protein KDE55_22095, partial [Novosphingobium sp.]|nr:hypothetical protein [Novosphingobium sp.]
LAIARNIAAAIFEYFMQSLRNFQIIRCALKGHDLRPERRKNRKRVHTGVDEPSDGSPLRYETCAALAGSPRGAILFEKRSVSHSMCRPSIPAKEGIGNRYGRKFNMKRS